MSAQVERGYLVLADISGYTGYLAETELDHANEILGDLIGQVVDGLVPPLRLAEVEGDAVFAYGPSRRGETLLEVAEQTYGAFRRRRELMEARTSCPCNACRQIGTLELKFIVHEGEYVLQGVGGQGQAKPVGSDVNLAHRLLKNSVAAETGWQSYVLLTEPVRAASGLAAEGLHRRTESYEHLGDVATTSYDLAPRWQAHVEAERPQLDAANCHWSISVPVEAPQAVVWDCLNDTEARMSWTATDAVERVRAREGRSGAGDLVHCHHGARLQTFKVVQWRPFDFLIEEMRAGPGARVTVAYLLSPAGTGTDLTVATRLTAPLPGPLAAMVCRRKSEGLVVPQVMRIRELAVSAPRATAT